MADKKSAIGFLSLFLTPTIDKESLTQKSLVRSADEAEFCIKYNV